MIVDTHTHEKKVNNSLNYSHVLTTWKENQNTKSNQKKKEKTCKFGGSQGKEAIFDSIYSGADD